MSTATPTSQADYNAIAAQTGTNVGKVYNPNAQAPAVPYSAPTISSDNLNPVQPVVVPPIPNSGATPSSSIMGITKSLNDSQTALQQDVQGNVDAAQQNYNNSQDNVQNLINEYSGKGQEQLNLENQANIPGLRTEANNLTTQYLTTEEAYNANYDRIVNTPGLTKQQVSDAIGDLTQQHSYSLANVGIQQAIAQNQYQTAQTLVDHQIDVMYSPLKDQIDYGMQFLTNNKDILTQQQQESFQANLQVQQQKYTDGTYYAHLNNDTAIQMISDAAANKAPSAILSQMSSLLASGASAGDIAAAGGQYLSNGSYSYQFNPTTGQFSMINSKTGLAADGTSPGSGQPTISATDPSAAKIVKGADGSTYDFSSYATDPQYGLKLTATSTAMTQAVGTIDNAQSAEAAIQTYDPNSPLTGDMIYTAASQNGIDPTTFAAQLKLESGFGTSAVAENNNNYGGVKYAGQANATQGTKAPDGGYYAKFDTPEDGLNAQAQLVASKYKTAPAPTAPGQTTDIQANIKNVQAIKAALPANISGAVNYITSTGNGYIDLSKVTDLPGYPSGYAQTQALQYAKQFGLAPLNASQVQAVQDYDTAMTKINTLQDQWNAIAPDGFWSKVGDVATDPLSVIFDTQRGQNLVQYGSNSAAAISTFNNIVDSKRLSNFSSNLSEAALPQAPHSRGLGNISNGDTLQDGNLKLDNLRNDLNASLLNIDPSFKPAPLSSQLPSEPLPQAGDVRMIGNVKVQYNANGSATVIQ